MSAQCVWIWTKSQNHLRSDVADIANQTHSDAHTAHQQHSGKKERKYREKIETNKQTTFCSHSTRHTAQMYCGRTANGPSVPPSASNKVALNAECLIYIMMDGHQATISRVQLMLDTTHIAHPFHSLVKMKTRAFRFGRATICAENNVRMICFVKQNKRPKSSACSHTIWLGNSNSVLRVADKLLRTEPRVGFGLLYAQQSHFFLPWVAKLFQWNKAHFLREFFVRNELNLCAQSIFCWYRWRAMSINHCHRHKPSMGFHHLLCVVFNSSVHSPMSFSPLSAIAVYFDIYRNCLSRERFNFADGPDCKKYPVQIQGNFGGKWQIPRNVIMSILATMFLTNLEGRSQIFFQTRGLQFFLSSIRAWCRRSDQVQKRHDRIIIIMTLCGAEKVIRAAWTVNWNSKCICIRTSHTRKTKMRCAMCMAISMHLFIYI